MIAKDRYEPANTVAEGIERMERENFVFLWPKETMDLLLSKNCKFTTLKGNDEYVEY